MIKIYHTKGRGLRVIWLCEELKIEYQIQKVDFSKEFRFSKEWQKLIPGKVTLNARWRCIAFGHAQ